MMMLLVGAMCVRVEYDAYRIDAEARQCRPETQQAFQQHKLKFDQLRQVLDIKLQLLDENRVQPRTVVHAYELVGLTSAFQTVFCVID